MVGNKDGTVTIWDATKGVAICKNKLINSF
jgi:hypothetical protein